jgi:hypothetical protein
LTPSARPPGSRITEKRESFGRRIAVPDSEVFVDRRESIIDLIERVILQFDLLAGHVRTGEVEHHGARFDSGWMGSRDASKT